MKIELAPGKYVVAVSGGVDSVVLLDLLRLTPGVKLVVAHYDHGIRQNSARDRKHVETLAARYRLPFVYDLGQLGPGASEAEARTARYRFLNKVREVSGSHAIVTAHHQDDVLETAVLNLLRGTGRKGLSSLTSGEGIIRPLTRVPKSEIIDYARRHGLTWVEDETNSDTGYARNHVRHDILAGWNEADKARLIRLTHSTEELNKQIDSILTDELEDELKRDWFIMLPHDVAREVMAGWLRRGGIREFDRAGIERVTVAAKTAAPGRVIDVVKGNWLAVRKDKLALVRRER